MIRILLILLSIAMISSQCFALEVLNIEKQYGDKIPFSISHINETVDDMKLQKIVEIVKNDLSNTIDMQFKGIFNYKTESGILDLKRYRYEGALFNINIHIDKRSDDFIAEIKVYDTKSEVILFEKKYSFKDDTLRKLAHVISDLSYYSMTGKNGYFQSKILYTSNDKIKNLKSKKSIYVIDQDGFGERLLVSGGILTNPIYNKYNKSVMYIDNTTGEPTVQASNITTGVKVNLGTEYSHSDKFNITSSFSMCNKSGSVYTANITQSGSDIYIVTKDSISKIASGGINVTPSSSPDDSQIVFESNTDGRRNLYISDTSIISSKKMLVGNDGVYAEPKWSYDGEWIAFTKIRNGLFHLGIIKPDGTEEKILFSSYLLENPTWMPNSDSILVSEKKSYTSNNVLKIIDLNGKEIREIKTSTGATHPSVMIIR